MEVAKGVRRLIRKLYITYHLWGEIKNKVAESTLIIQEWGIGLHIAVWILQYITYFIVGMPPMGAPRPMMGGPPPGMMR